jgi:NADPH:quinone reductase-like Zn-dependent oxidoreductase
VKALVSRKAGGPETLVLEELPEPVVGPGQVRVAVQRFPLSRGAEAIARLAAREARGKIVVLVQ